MQVQIEQDFHQKKKKNSHPGSHQEVHKDMTLKRKRHI